MKIRRTNTRFEQYPSYPPQLSAEKGRCQTLPLRLPSMGATIWLFADSPQICQPRAFKNHPANEAIHSLAAQSNAAQDQIQSPVPNCAISGCKASYEPSTPTATRPGCHWPRAHPTWYILMSGLSVGKPGPPNHRGAM